MKTQTFMILMAAIGGYAAWLTIQEKQRKEAVNTWFVSGAFQNGELDFYGQPDQTSLDYLIDLDNQQPASIFEVFS